MKNKLFVLLAVIVVALSVPFVSGCGARAEFVLREDEQGNKYYVVSCAGYTSSFGGEYVIPETYGEGEDKAPVTEIAMQGFAGTRITKITIPATVTKIGNAAFAHCNELTEVVFADGSAIDEISRGCFGYCMFLKKINIPATVRSIGILAFSECYRLDEVVLPAGLEQIKLKAFYNAGIPKVVIPDGVKEIGVAAFHGCVNMRLAAVGEGVKKISAGAFGYCTSLEKIYLPLSLEKIDGAHYTDGSEEIKYEDGTFYCGHAFHDDGALSDVYFAGVREEWETLKKNIDNKPVTESGATMDNSALFKATLHYSSPFTE